jgi:ABC-type multidrug transport system fused ATPase/permease subunit
MDAIKKIKKDKTIILITHRLKTIENCDIVYRMYKGEIIDIKTKSGIFEN